MSYQCEKFVVGFGCRLSRAASADCRLSVSLSVVFVGSWLLGVGCWLSVVDGCAAFRSVVPFSVLSSDTVTTRLDLIYKRLDLIHKRLDLIQKRRDLIHKRLDLIHKRLDLIHSRLDLIHSKLNRVHTRLNLIHTRLSLIQYYRCKKLTLQWRSSKT